MEPLPEPLLLAQGKGGGAFSVLDRERNAYDRERKRYGTCHSRATGAADESSQEGAAAQQQSTHS